MSALSHQTELPLAPRPRERTLEFVVLSALGDPGVVPCPICRGPVSYTHLTLPTNREV